MHIMWHASMLPWAGREQAVFFLCKLIIGLSPRLSREAQNAYPTPADDSARVKAINTKMGRPGNQNNCHYPVVDAE